MNELSYAGHLARLAIVAGAVCLSAPMKSFAQAEIATDRLAWYREARFGLFIHWGLYAQLGGVYKGQRVERGIGPGIGEWIMYNAKIPVAEYAAYAQQFNPVNFDADAWVRLAKEAGVRYIVITAKHHDGFAMFTSEASTFNIADATPFARDPLKELAAACRKHGIRLGFYYSQAQDWHHPGGAAYAGSGGVDGGNPAAGHWDGAQDGDFDQYLERIAIPQVRELLTNYGPLGILWWDTPVGMTPARAERLATLLKLQPRIITNNRLLNTREPNPYSGDTETPEQHIPATGLDGRLFEVCMTMNETWGYKIHDQNWKSASDLIRQLIDVASKGGNYLLNVGPNELGEIPAPSVERLRAIGAWMRANHEAIYGTTHSLFPRLPWGRSTTKGRVVYLHVFDWPADGRLVVPGLKTPVAAASLLATGKALKFEVKADGIEIALPTAPLDSVATAIKLECSRAPEVEVTLPAPDEKGVVHLPGALAAIVNAYGANTRLEGSGNRAHIGGWDRPETKLSWVFTIPRPGKYTLQTEASGAHPVTVGVTVGRIHFSATLSATAGLDDYRRADLGALDLPAGEHNLEIKSLGPDWSEVRLRGVRLLPTP